MHTLRSESAGHRLGEDPLGRLRWRKACEVRLPTVSRRVARTQNHAAPGFDHRRSDQPAQMEQRHRVHLEVTLQHIGVDRQEVAERAADCVVDDDGRIAHLVPDPIHRGGELSFVGDVTRERDGALQFARERLEPLRIAREQRDAVALGEAPRQRRSSARTDTGDQAHFLRVVRAVGIH